MIQRLKILWVLSFVGLVLSCDVVLGQAPIGAKVAALGNATTALYENEWGLFSNPASISQDALTVGFYGLQHFGFPEITDVSSAASFELLEGYSAIGFYRYGDDLYSETNINVGYKYSWKEIHAGLSIQYRHLNLGGVYGSGGAINITLGILTQLSETFWLGAKVRNLNRGAYNFEFNDEALPQDVSVGFSYKLENKATLIFDVLKDVRFPVNYRGGIEIEIVEDIIGRIGATYDPVTYTFGLGYSRENWQVNLTVQQHEILGVSPGADIILKL